jgi:hypothetical protein
MYNEECGLDSSGPEYDSVARFCDYGNERLGSMKDEEFVVQLSTEHRCAGLPAVTNCECCSNENRSGTVLIDGL